MASVWKRLQRVNKRAAKFQYTASYHQIDLETTAKWRPSKLSIVWTRRSRRVVAEPLEWEPSLKDPLKGSVIYPLPENHTIAVTLFKDSRSNDLEDKDWLFVLEDVTKSGKRRKLAQSPINMRTYASLSPTQRQLTVTLQPTTQKIVAAQLKLTLSSVLLAEGPANDEDMQSLASLLSVNNSDIAVLEDLDDEDYTLSDHSSRQVLDLRQQMEEMTHSLTNSDLATPNSVQSLCLDNSRTPTAVMTPSTPKSQEPMDRAPCFRDLSPHSDYKLPTINETKVEPKFTSTPQKQIEKEFQTESPSNPLKGITFRTKSITKINLKPLELKSNFNSMQSESKSERDIRMELERDDKTPVNEDRCDIEKTPAQDLLEWCQRSLTEYPSCEVSDLSTSWRSGLAFAALIHRYRPHFIDFSGLDPADAEGNLRAAFAASAKLGISQLITVNDVLRKNPDRLAIMTYLFQMRSHFEGKELQVEQLGNNVSESSYLVGRHDTDSRLPADLFSREVLTRRSQRGTLPKKDSTDSARITPERVKSPNAHTPDLLAHTNNIIGKALSPNHKTAEKTTKWFTDPLNIGNEAPPKPERLMTRRELNDPFASDDEIDKIGNTYTQQERKSSPPYIEPRTPVSPLQERLSSPTELPKPTPQLLSRHDELRERARQLLEATKKEAREKMRKQNSKDREDMSEECNGELGSKKPLSDEERQNVLRERARKLIADARAGVLSPQSPTRPRPQMEIITQKSVMEEYANGGVTQIDSLLARADSRSSTPRKSPSPDRSDSSKSDDTKSIKSLDRLSSRNKSSPLRSFSALVERLSPDSDSGEQYPALGSYIQHEQSALEREQLAIDAMAHALEPQLRNAMDTQEEDRLMSQWFNLVNKKNALLRRQMQLNIIEQEEDLSRRCELLARELRLSLAVEEWRKGGEQKLRERLLLQELLEAVNERDRLVQEMDEQEKAIADDDEIERNLSQVELQRKNNCILQ